MRLWSIHPAYLDARGLVAQWREGLLAKKVLEGKTRGYRYHPQLTRFYRSAQPLLFINVFLDAVYRESLSRGYRFDGEKIDRYNFGDFDGLGSFEKIGVTAGQAAYEFAFLQEKLARRDPAKYRTNLAVTRVELNEVFTIVPGGIEDWEVVKPPGAFN